MSLPTPVLTTARLRLRPFADSDSDDLLALHTSPRVMRYWDAPPWAGHDRASVFLARCLALSAEGSGARLAIERAEIERAEDARFVGWCSLTDWSAVHRSARLGYCLAELSWGHGYATESVGAVLDWAYRTLDLNRVQAEVDTRNAASARVLEKVGFLREGTLREDCVVAGEVSDSWVYGLLRRDRRRTGTSPEVVTTR